MKVKKGHEEIKWTDFVLLAIGESGWASIYEVTERVKQLMPPQLIYRKKRERASRGKGLVTIHSKVITVIGRTIRELMRKGCIERSTPIKSKFPRNIGNYSMKLTDAGVNRMRRIRRYVCKKCLHIGLTKAVHRENAQCGHCHARSLRFY